MPSFPLLSKFSCGSWSLPNRYGTTLETCTQIATGKRVRVGVTKRIAAILGREIGFTFLKSEGKVVYTRKELSYFSSETMLWQKLDFIPL